MTMKVCGSVPPSGYVNDVRDCCDASALAKVQTLPSNKWFEEGAVSSSQANCLHPFDYDCNQIEEKEFPDFGMCTSECFLEGTWDHNAVSSIPKCGENARAIGTCLGDEFNCNEFESPMLTQGCR
jgi:hypothetical protein